MKVRTAVLPAAGLGTRFLPATKSQPKEMIPVIDKPAIQYAVEEAVRAGVEDILIVTSRGKVTVEDHFDRSLELEHHLEKAGKTEYLEQVRAVADLAEFHYVRQKEPRGFGHAVLVAKKHVGTDPFYVLVPDEIVPEPRLDEASLLDKLAEIYEREGASAIAVVEVPDEDVSAYGIVATDDVVENVGRIRSMVEKPPVREAPSRLAARGRYLFTPEIFDALEKTSEGVGGEIQLTDAINEVAEQGAVYAYIHDGPIFDVGKTLDYLRTTVELALRRDDLSGPFRDFLREALERG
ncbi:MAG: UTP--glucose-1-phosphate uridylyltransferase GalU [Actinobacteria bacterium]|nr:UTP--glucose-1-phosphate uridylyltransferase GalU [Actinomycetota bacterium]